MAGATLYTVIVADDEDELRELTDSALEKLRELSDADYEQLELIPDFMD